MDLTGVGVQPATQTKILADPKLKTNADSGVRQLHRVLRDQHDDEPFDNIDCRKAVECAVDKETDPDAVRRLGRRR